MVNPYCAFTARPVGSHVLRLSSVGFKVDDDLMGVAENARSNPKSAVAAIIVVALIGAGAIFMAADAAPDECEKWNYDLYNAAVNIRHGRDTVADSEDHPAIAHMRQSLWDTESDLRTLLAEPPDDCVMDDKVEEEVRRVDDDL